MRRSYAIGIPERIWWRWHRKLVQPVVKNGWCAVPSVPVESIDIPDSFNSTAMTWVGHSTWLIQMDDVNILTDPVWSTLVGPWNRVGPKRLTPPAVPWEKLPRIDVVLISHVHYDHLDKPTVLRLQRDFDPVFYVPLRVKRILAEWGITRVEEKDWWEAVDEYGVSIVCTPAQHTSRRGFFDVDTTLWCGWLISGADETVFFAGDTGYFPAFGEIRDRSPRRIDVAALPIGAYEPRWFMRYMHMNPADALRAYQDLDARFLAPMHWGAFDVTDEPLEEPPEKLLHTAESFGIHDDAVWLFATGETRVIP